MPPRPDYPQKKVFTLNPEGGYSLARNVAGASQGAAQQAGGTYTVPELSVTCLGDSGLPCHRIGVWMKSSGSNVTAGGIPEWCLINATDKNSDALMAPVTLTGCYSAVGGTGGQAGGCVEVARQDLVYSSNDLVFLAGWKACSDLAAFVGSGPLVAVGTLTSNQDLKYSTVNLIRPEWITVFGALESVKVTAPAGAFTTSGGASLEWWRGLVVWVESFAWPGP